MSGADLAFYVSAGLTMGGALVVVAARRTPITNAVGAVVSMTGVAVACGLAGAPLLGAMSLLTATGVALVIVLYTLEWVGTGRDALPPARFGRMLVRGAAALATVALAAVLLDGTRVWPRDVAVADPPTVDPSVLGLRFFGAEPIAVAVCGLLLLVAVMAGITLAARRPS